MNDLHNHCVIGILRTLTSPSIAPQNTRTLHTRHAHPHFHRTVSSTLSHPPRLDDNLSFPGSHRFRLVILAPSRQLCRVFGLHICRKCHESPSSTVAFCRCIYASRLGPSEGAIYECYQLSGSCYWSVVESLALSGCSDLKMKKSVLDWQSVSRSSSLKRVHLVIDCSGLLVPPNTEQQLSKNPPG